MSLDWYYADRNVRVGPVSFQELTTRLGTLPNPAEVWVWCESFSDWKKARDVPELRPRKVPPPIPQETSSPNSEWSQRTWKIPWWWIVVALGFPLGGVGNRVGRAELERISADRRAARIARYIQKTDTPKSSQNDQQIRRAWTLATAALVIFFLLFAELMRGEKHNLAYSPISAIGAGLLIALILVLIVRLARKRQAKAPRVSRYIGNGFYWLGIFVVVWLVGVGGYAVYSRAPSEIVAFVALSGAFYAIVTWGLRHILMR